jgi:hypothetical protein
LGTRVPPPLISPPAGLSCGPSPRSAGHASSRPANVLAVRSNKKLVLLVLIYAALVFGGSYFGERLSKGFDFTSWMQTERIIDGMIVGGVVLYVLLTAIPFVPGVELGLALIFACGVRIVPVVYVATIAALLLSFCAGRLIKEKWLAAGFHWLGMRRAAAMVDSLSGLDGEARINRLLEQAPQRFAPWLMRHRFLALIALINLPGSALLGGGGGISMAVGMSRLVSFPMFLASALIGVAPLPLFLIASAALSG